MSSDQFYRDFEAAFRGDRSEIIGRLEVYLDFILPLLDFSSERRAIDLGCGRGEWLELLGLSGFKPHGVDLDQGMLEDCYALGLSAEHGDAIAYLRNLPDDSQAIVSGFHIAEHLPFEVLQDLIQNALRVLEPGGLLILETPNAENLRVGTLSFHMDPTHNKPLPPGLLSFLPRHYGFARCQVVRLQESPQLRAAQTATLFDVFQGVSPDFAIVAQKAADDGILKRFDAAFAKDRGLTLETLSNRFESQLVHKAEFELHKSEIEQLRAEFNERVDAVYASTSWRVTAPLRGMGSLARSARAGARTLLGQSRARVRSAGLGAVMAVHKRPALRRPIIGAIKKFPRLEAWLRARIAAGNQAEFTTRKQSVSAQLTPRAKAIHTKIQQLRGRR